MDEYNALHEFYYDLRDKAVDKIEQCDVQIQFLEYELDNGE
jgi:hypothetical protein